MPIYTVYMYYHDHLYKYFMFCTVVRMTWFEAFRGEFGYTFYGEKRTSVTVDISLAAVVYACILISIATIIAAAGIKGKEVRSVFVPSLY